MSEINGVPEDLHGAYGLAKDGMGEAMAYSAMENFLYRLAEGYREEGRDERAGSIEAYVDDLKAEGDVEEGLDFVSAPLFETFDKAVEHIVSSEDSEQAYQEVLSGEFDEGDFQGFEYVAENPEVYHEIIEGFRSLKEDLKETGVSLAVGRHPGEEPGEGAGEAGDESSGEGYSPSSGGDTVLDGTPIRGDLRTSPSPEGGWEYVDESLEESSLGFLAKEFSNSSYPGATADFRIGAEEGAQAFAQNAEYIQVEFLEGDSYFEDSNGNPVVGLGDADGESYMIESSPLRVGEDVDTGLFVYQGSGGANRGRLLQKLISEAEEEIESELRESEEREQGFGVRYHFDIEDALQNAYRSAVDDDVAAEDIDTDRVGEVLGERQSEGDIQDLLEPDEGMGGEAVDAMAANMMTHSGAYAFRVRVYDDHPEQADGPIGVTELHQEEGPESYGGMDLWNDVKDWKEKEWIVDGEAQGKAGRLWQGMFSKKKQPLRESLKPKKGGDDGGILRSLLPYVGDEVLYHQGVRRIMPG